MFSLNFNKLNKEISDLLIELNIPGISIYINMPENENDIEINYGFSDFENNIWMKKGTKFRIGSLTKSFTATAILILNDRNLLDLKDPVKKYLDIENDFIKNLKIKDLMNMSSGLRDYINDDPEEYGFILKHLINSPKNYLTQEELLEKAFQITEELGLIEGFHYNNTNYILLGMIIEKVSGQKYERFIKEEILIPLQLNDTFVPENYFLYDNMAKGYHDLINDEKYIENSEIDPSYVWSAGSIVSNAKDLSKWIKELSKGTLISEKSKKYLFEGQHIFEDVYYTSGVIYEDNKLWHNGSVIGYNSIASYFFDTDTSISILINGYSQVNLIEIIFSLLLEDYL
jgi:D-alanyl-D-alanine carboxypeptidase